MGTIEPDRGGRGGPPPPDGVTGVDPGIALTVVIPVWDAPYVNNLQRAVASVRSGGAEVPLVVVDNASSTPIPPLAEATVVRAPRRLSTGGARNLGLERVRTEFVVFLDADDELIDGALPALERGIAADRDLVAYAMSMLDSETGARHRVPRRAGPWIARAPRLFALVTAVWSLYPTQGSTVLRTEAVREAGGYGDLSRGEDWALAVSLALRGRVRYDLRPAQIYHRDAGPGSARVFGIDEVRTVHRRIRERIRADPRAPGWIVSMLPLIRGLQFVARLLVPTYRAGRSLADSRRTVRHAAAARGSRSNSHSGRQA